MSTEQHHCSVCSDAADRVIIVEIDHPDAIAQRSTGEQISIAIDLVPDLKIGDTVLVHQGTAIARAPSEGENT